MHTWRVEIFSKAVQSHGHLAAPALPRTALFTRADAEDGLARIVGAGPAIVRAHRLEGVDGLVRLREGG
ncbi:hypothetical protein ACFUT3_32755 [Streptomyces cinereoruber]|uniref:hypothetical protein n=1 Tax=Streptomyces cinereoruber TaxID=67260 RepID=UPI003629F00D